MNIDPLSDAAARIMYAAQALAELIPYTAPGTGLPQIVVNACLEDWFTNERLMAEFLIGGKPRNIMTVRQFLPAWRVHDPTIRSFLGREYNLASAYVSHVGRRESIGEPINVSQSSLRARARTILEPLRDFAEALADDPDLEAYSTPFHNAVRLAEEALHEQEQRALGSSYECDPESNVP